MEPEPDCCTLCQSDDRPLTNLMSSEPLAKQFRKYIRDCLKIVTNPQDDKNTRICSDCGEKLQSYNFFHLQGQSNDVFLKQLPEGAIAPDEHYCRLCLGLRGNMSNVFPTNGQADNPLCEIILECVGVNLSYYQDCGAQICPLCRSQLEVFTTFKRISKQILLDIPDSESQASANNSTESLTGTDPESLLEVMGVEPEPTVVTKKPRGRKRKQKRQRELVEPKQIKVDPEPEFVNSSVVFAKSGRQRVYRMLWVANDERNFEVIKETKGRAKVTIDGYRFVYSTEKPGGSSVWICEWKTLHNCRYTITIDADTKIATFPKGMVHPHEPEPTRLLKCPLGKGAFLQDDGTEDPFWLVGDPQPTRTYDRHLFYHDQRYVLRSINAMTDTSEWVCKTAKCTARVEIIDVFKFISLVSTEHRHPAVTNRELTEALRSCKINPNSKDVITPFREQSLLEQENSKMGRRTEFQGPSIYTKMATDDANRNYDAIKIKDNLFKFCYDEYEYKYYLRMDAGATLWKCIWESLNNCNAMALLSPDAKRAQMYGDIEHCHPTAAAPIFNCDLIKYSVRNITSATDEPIELLARECVYFESRSLIYRKHIYNLNQIVNQTETRWSCIKTDANGKKCQASLVVNGRMESFLHKGLHCDPVMTDAQLRNIILPGNMLDLSIQQDAQSWSDDSEPEEPSLEAPPDVLIMLKQQLFKFPLGRGTIWDKKEGKVMPFYFLKDTVKQDDNAFLIFYQKHRYSFATIDEYGVSQWICSKLLQTDEKTCTAHVTVEGVFQRLMAKGKHNHEGAAMMEYVFKPEGNLVLADMQV